jgi:hypothetical protein
MADVIRRPRRALRAAAALAVLLLAPGCGLFKPASPEIATGGRGLVGNYTHPESCLSYMKLGIEQKGAGGLQLYIGALADTSIDLVGFHALFDPADWNSALSSNPPDDWDLGYERDFFNNFALKRSYPYLMIWTPDSLNWDDKSDDNAWTLYRHYEVFSLETTQGGVDSVLFAVGYAELHFIRVSASRWALRIWKDRIDPMIGANPANELWRTMGYRRLKPSG